MGERDPPTDGFLVGRGKRDPSKWTEYDLKDVGTGEMSGMTDEQVNRRAAYQFLDDLKKQRQTRDNEEDDMTGSKIVFKKPTGRVEKDSKVAPSDSVLNRTLSKETTTTSFTPGSAAVRTLPEYVVGAKAVANRNKLGKKVTQLSSLTMEDGNETENNTSSEYGMETGHSLRGSGRKTRERNRRVSKNSAVTLSHLEDED